MNRYPATSRSALTEGAQRARRVLELKRRRKDLQADIADADRKHKDLVAEVGHLSKETSHRASRLDEARSNQSAGRSNNRVLESLQTLAASGRVSVFHVRRLSYPNPVLYLII